MRLDGKVALISGGAAGMGAAIARLFATEGARVVLGDRDETRGRALAIEIGALFVPLDVASETSWQAAVALVDAEHGRLDVLVNNAGILKRAPIENCTRAEFDQVIAVNQTGVFLGMKTALPLMKRTGGSMVNISSTAGLRGARDHVAYVASKFAVRGMTKVAAIEFAPFGIRVNSVHPGLVRTDMINQYFQAVSVESFTAQQLIDRPADPREVAEMVLFLASDSASFSTGAEFVCDGGLMTGSR